MNRTHIQVSEKHLTSKRALLEALDAGCPIGWPGGETAADVPLGQVCVVMREDLQMYYVVRNTKEGPLKGKWRLVTRYEMGDKRPHRKRKPAPNW